MSIHYLIFMTNKNNLKIVKKVNLGKIYIQSGKNLNKKFMFVCK